MNKNIQTINILFGLSNLILVFYYISTWILNDFEMTGGSFAVMWFELIIITFCSNVVLMIQDIYYERRTKTLTLDTFFSVVVMIVIVFGLIMLNLLKIDHKEKNIYDEKNIYIETEGEKNENKIKK